MVRAHVNPEILAWARQRADFDHATLARKLSVKEDNLRAWESGDSLPTFKQAQNFARAAYVPFGYLFLREPPEEELPIPDLRTVGDHWPPRISVNLRDTLREAMQRQSWYRDYQQDREANPVAVVGCVEQSVPVAEIVASLREGLGLPERRERGTWDEYFQDLVARIEGLGILVMRSSTVGTNTHRPLDVSEFRGFAIADTYAPVIFINAADIPEARLFTLIHELAHIWLGQSGLTDVDPGNRHQLEQVCNKVAAEFLVPEREFQKLWDSAMPWEANLPPLAANFHVSQWVIARRARELELVDDDAYRSYVRRRLNEHRQRDRQGAPSFQTVQKSRIGTRFAQAVASEALSGRLLLRDAYRLTGIRPENLASFARRELGF